MATRKPATVPTEADLPEHLKNADPKTVEAYLASIETHDERQASFEVDYLDKDEYIGSPFDILKVETRIGASLSNEDDWAVTVRDPDGREGVMTFDKNRFRDELMRNLSDVVKKYGSIPYHTLQELPGQPGQSNPYTIVPMGRWKAVEAIEAERSARKRERKARRGK